MGHARNGGGPDFRPVPLAWRDGRNEPIYSYYLRQRVNYHKMLDSLSTSSARPKLLAILGCNSMRKFYQSGLDAFTDTTGFMLSGELSWPQNRPGYLGLLLDGIFSQRCRSAWSKNLRDLDRAFAKKEQYRLYGRFLNH